MTGIQAGSEDQWFEAMDTLIQDRPLREQLAGAGWAKVKSEWDWSEPAAREKWKPLVTALDRMA